LNLLLICLKQVLCFHYFLQSKHSLTLFYVDRKQFLILFFCLDLEILLYRHLFLRSLCLDQEVLLKFHRKWVSIHVWPLDLHPKWMKWCALEFSYQDMLWFYHLNLFKTLISIQLMLFFYLTCQALGFIIKKYCLQVVQVRCNKMMFWSKESNMMRDKGWLILRIFYLIQHCELCFQCDRRLLDSKFDPFHSQSQHLCKQLMKFYKVKVSNKHFLWDMIGISFALYATLSQHRLEQSLQSIIVHFKGRYFPSDRISSYLFLQGLTFKELFLRVAVHFLHQRRFLQDNQVLLWQMEIRVFHSCAFQRQIVSSIRSI